MNGFFNRLAVIDLTRQKMEVLPIDNAQVLSSVGGKGLGTHLLLAHNPTKVDPLSPDNCMLIGTGPLADSPIWGSCRYGVFSKSPLTGYYADSYSGGKASIAISRTGYDFVLVRGASDEPVWLEISDREVTFHDARKLWGKDAGQTKRAVKTRCGVEGCGALVIGPAGENLVRFAVIGNDDVQSVGHAGMGAVMGAKKVKAMVFHGKARRTFHDPDAMAALAEKMAIDENINVRCMEGLINTFGRQCGIRSIENTAWLNELCDQLGLDRISAGYMAALAIEASRQGRIHESFNPGDASAIAGLLHKITLREGIGGLLADGIQSVAMEMDMTGRRGLFKGMAPAGYDIGAPSRDMGPFHWLDPVAARPEHPFYLQEWTQMTCPDPVDYNTQLLIEFEDRCTLLDSLILCPYFSKYYSWEMLSTLLSMAWGVALDRADLEGRAAGIIDVVRRFNLQEGLIPADDVLPGRLPEQQQGGEEGLINSYYRFRGWSEQGRPPSRSGTV